MKVTIMSDASFCPKTRSAGYGVWIKSERGQDQVGGVFKEKPIHAAEAEAQAACIAVWRAFATRIAQEGDHLIVQVDCMLVIDIYKESVSAKALKNPINQRTRLAVQKAVELVKEKRASVEFRHVKGHSAKTAPRNYINDLCDNMAKKAMKAQRNAAEEKSPP